VQRPRGKPVDPVGREPLVPPTRTTRGHPWVRGACPAQRAPGWCRAHGVPPTSPLHAWCADVAPTAARPGRPSVCRVPLAPPATTWRRGVCRVPLAPPPCLLPRVALPQQACASRARADTSWTPSPGCANHALAATCTTPPRAPCKPALPAPPARPGWARAPRAPRCSAAPKAQRSVSGAGSPWGPWGGGRAAAPSSPPPGPCSPPSLWCAPRWCSCVCGVGHGVVHWWRPRPWQAARVDLPGRHLHRQRARCRTTLVVLLSTAVTVMTTTPASAVRLRTRSWSWTQGWARGRVVSL
jgi:hypothetical protein